VEYAMCILPHKQVGKKWALFTHNGAEV
jgi:hypothetical protein